MGKEQDILETTLQRLMQCVDAVTSCPLLMKAVGGSEQMMVILHYRELAREDPVPPHGYLLLASDDLIDLIEDNGLLDTPEAYALDVMRDEVRAAMAIALGAHAGMRN